jgi:hypothetical protein
VGTLHFFRARPTALPPRPAHHDRAAGGGQHEIDGRDLHDRRVARGLALNGRGWLASAYELDPAKVAFDLVASACFDRLALLRRKRDRPEADVDGHLLGCHRDGPVALSRRHTCHAERCCYGEADVSSGQSRRRSRDDRSLRQRDDDADGFLRRSRRGEIIVPYG